MWYLCMALVKKNLSESYSEVPRVSSQPYRVNNTDSDWIRRIAISGRLGFLRGQTSRLKMRDVELFFPDSGKASAAQIHWAVAASAVLKDLIHLSTLAAHQALRQPSYNISSMNPIVSWNLSMGTRVIISLGSHSLKFNSFMSLWTFTPKELHTPITSEARSTQFKRTKQSITTPNHQ